MSKRPTYAEFAKWRSANLEATTNQVIAAFPALDSMGAHMLMSIYRRRNKVSTK